MVKKKSDHQIKYFLLLTHLIFLLNCPIYAQESALPEILKSIDSARVFFEAKFKETVFEFEEFSIMKFMTGDGEIEQIDTTLTLITRKGRELISRRIIKSTADTKKRKKRGERKFDIKFTEDNPNYKFTLLKTTESTYEIAYTPRGSKTPRGKSQGTFLFDKNNFRVIKIKAITPNPAEENVDELKMEIKMVRLDNGLNVAARASIKGKASALFGLVKKQFQMENKYSNYKIIRKKK